MTALLDFDKIELQLVRVLQTLIVERSVSKAALRLGSTQPAISEKLRRLRALTGDPLLVRSGAGMTPTTVALELLAPAERLLREADQLFGTRLRRGGFDPATAELRFRIAASDYLDPLFLPELVTRLQRQAPGVQLDLHPLTADYDYRAALARGEVDLVIGNWLEPPGELHMGRLLTDEVVCLVSQQHPAARMSARAWTQQRYLDCQHLAPMPLSPGQSGVIEQHLLSLGLERRIAVRGAHFGQLPQMVARSLLVLTTGRLFCRRYLDQLPVTILRCPVAFPPMTYYQLWHDLSHHSAPLRWLREQVREVAKELVKPV
ncbi:LysR family transcriptional regulator [Roseateles depolymerans]|uniref:Transcriptional regulator, LysR family n=1 Tax=Roseateles depolymerans TaxID=76731 RepID=A0A0U3MLS1_9BURK|nr:LysR family transcriptional regulator [Roseateles depolymerans]ALV08412.1 Transcriptional regulator, LysR family [Roseateles depolymerans]REG21363.1 DNA-binding transcriptional LysR family regulator [Roseateles depolymerans]